MAVSCGVGETSNDAESLLQGSTLLILCSTTNRSAAAELAVR